MKNLFLLSATIGILVISGSIAYHFLYFLPQQEVESKNIIEVSGKKEVQNQDFYKLDSSTNKMLECIQRQEFCLIELCGDDPRKTSGPINELTEEEKYKLMKQEQEQTMCVLNNAMAGACKISC